MNERAELYLEDIQVCLIGPQSHQLSSSANNSENRLELELSTSVQKNIDWWGICTEILC